MRALYRNLILVLVTCSLFVSGCVYYNTFYNARTAFDEAEDLRKDSPGDRPRIDKNKYRIAIEKSEKVVENHPNSKWYDDAVWVMAVSYFYLEEYSRAERRFREILANYPESDYATEAELYLAKSKLLQNEVDEAMAQFRSIFDGDFKKEHKAEAAMALGDYLFERQDYEESRRYFMAVRDSLGSGEQRARVQQYIADGYFERFQFSDALSAYLQMLGMNPTTDQYYHALYYAALSSLRLQRIDDGLDYLNTLIEDDRYYDSLGVLRLTVAQGYEYDEDLDAAVAVYDKVHAEETNRQVNAQAAYRLGLIYQFDYDDLEQAKVYYDTTVKLDRRSDIGQEALQRSSDIGKLTSFSKKLAIEADSTTTQAAIDEAGYTQYQLAELYWFKLNKPDTAMMEMRYLVDSMPRAYDAPKGLIALSQMELERYNDTAAADSLLNLVLTRFPHSDYVEEAIRILGLEGTEADTGYAGKYFRKAESLLVDEENVDSALYYYQYVVDNFPDSRFNLQARFAAIYATELYDAPGDSSLIFAYNEIVDSFPSSPWATLARAQVAEPAGGRQRQQPDEPSDDDVDEEGDEFYADTTGAEAPQPRDDDYVDPMQSLYIGPDGEELSLLPEAIRPVEVIEKFEYPEEAYAERWEGYLYFQIKLDFAGEVIDFVQKTFAPHPEINLRAERAMGSSTFNITEIRDDLQDQWLVYKFEVRLPDHIR